MNTRVKPEDQTERGFLLRLRVKAVDAMETAYADHGEDPTWWQLRSLVETVDARLEATDTTREADEPVEALPLPDADAERKFLMLMRKTIVDVANSLKTSDPLRNRLVTTLWQVDGWLNIEARGLTSRAQVEALIRATGQATFGGAMTWIQQKSLAVHQEARGCLQDADAERKDSVREQWRKYFMRAALYRILKG